LTSQSVAIFAYTIAFCARTKEFWHGLDIILLIDLHPVVGILPHQINNFLPHLYCG